MCLNCTWRKSREERAREGARERERERKCVRACVCMCFASRTCACISRLRGPRGQRPGCVYTCRSKGDRCAARLRVPARAGLPHQHIHHLQHARRTVVAAAGAAMHANTALRTHPPLPPPPPARPPAPRPRRPRRRGSARGRRCAPSRAASREGPLATACFRGGAALCAHAAPPAAAE